MTLQQKGRRTSDLFTVRVWRESVSEGQVEWRGRIEHVLSGEGHYFRTWSTLIDYLIKMLPVLENQGEEDILLLGGNHAKVN